MLNRLKSMGAGFYLLLASLILTIVGFIYFFLTFNTFSYSYDKFVIALTIIAIYGTLFLLINGFLAGDRPRLVSIFYVINVFALMISFAYFLIPCLSPIGILFTVSMGDMETYAKGVPLCFVGVGCYVIAVILTVIAAFFPMIKKKAGEQYEF